MKVLGRFAAVTGLLLLAACGGGGGNPGTQDGGNNGGGGGTPVNGTVVVQTYSQTGGETAVSNFSSSDLTVYAKAIVKDKSGSAIPNAIVTFSEKGSGLLEFLPESATALTNSVGVAEIDLKATTLTSQGATQLVATATVTDKTGADVTFTGVQNLSISGAVIQDPQVVATAINFKNAMPSDKSIVIAGAGGNGRSETALLTFSVVDSSGSPLKGVTVDFTAVPVGSVTLNTPKGTTNSSGEVTATVNSTSQATSVTIKATVRGRNISTQSDTLTVTTSVSTQRGFDLSASKFNMDLDLSGDLSTLTVRIVDQNGNPVADGVPVVAQADFGRVGASSRGGCTTINGACTVEYQVQNPRPADGIPITVAFSTQTGQGAQISDTLSLWGTSVGWLNLYDTAVSAGPTNGLSLAVSDKDACKFASVSLFLGTTARLAAPAGTVIKVTSLNGFVTPTIVDGSPTLDRENSRTQVTLAASGKSGNAAGSDTWRFTFSAGPSKTVRSVDVPVTAASCQ